MTKQDDTIQFDGVDYKLSELSDHAKTQVNNLQFVDMQLQQLSNEWAVADTARIGYINALKREFKA